jgi:hypothetical protein
MSGGPELSQVEQPFLDQLASMGWKVVTGSVDFPSARPAQSGRVYGHPSPLSCA